MESESGEDHTSTNSESKRVAGGAALAAGHVADVLWAAAADSPCLREDLAALDLTGRPRVGLAGDWHGNLGWAERSLKRLSGLGVRTVLHSGDFGLWPGEQGAKYIRRVTAVCEQHDLTIRITDGNHDDHSRLAMIEPVDGVRWVTDRIGFFERGHRWLWADTTLVSLGGAPSVDFEHRTSGKTWWPEEVITDDEVRSATADGHADVMLTHDAPEPALPAVQRILDGPSYWSEAALVYAAEGRAQVTKAFSGVTPRLLIHGHMHVADRGAVRIPGAPWDTQVVSLNCDEGVGNLGTLDLESLNVEVI